MGDSRWLNFASTLFELSKYALILAVLASAFVVFLGTPILVRGESMKPNFASGEAVVIERVSFAGERTIRRGDVVAAKFPADPTKTRLIKRVVGLPGERVKAVNGAIYVNGQLLDEPYEPITGTPPYEEMTETTLKTGEYFLVGDNRPGSSDSRLWGPVVRQDILGRVGFALWPIKTARYIERPEYQNPKL